MVRDALTAWTLDVRLLISIARLVTAYVGLNNLGDAGVDSYELPDGDPNVAREVETALWQWEPDAAYRQELGALADSTNSYLQEVATTW